jgi:hypothetical protein
LPSSGKASISSTVTRAARRIVLHLPRACPWLEPWRQVARAVGARAG